MLRCMAVSLTRGRLIVRAYMLTCTSEALRLTQGRLIGAYIRPGIIGSHWVVSLPASRFVHIWASHRVIVNDIRMSARDRKRIPLPFPDVVYVFLLLFMGLVSFYSEHPER
jgi:hypothetical protein